MPGSLKFGRKVLFEMIRTAKNLLNIFKISFKKKLGKYFEKNPQTLKTKGEKNSALPPSLTSI